MREEENLKFLKRAAAEGNKKIRRDRRNKLRDETETDQTYGEELKKQSRWDPRTNTLPSCRITPGLWFIGQPGLFYDGIWGYELWALASLINKHFPHSTFSGLFLYLLSLKNSISLTHNCGVERKDGQRIEKETSLVGSNWKKKKQQQHKEKEKLDYEHFP